MLRILICTNGTVHRAAANDIDLTRPRGPRLRVQRLVLSLSRTADDFASRELHDRAHFAFGESYKNKVFERIKKLN